MSRSDDNEANFIGLLEDPADRQEDQAGDDRLRRTGRGAFRSRKQGFNLLTLMSGVTGRSIPGWSNFEGKMCGHLKELGKRTDAVVALLRLPQAASG